jgi:hypothetical protein
MVDIENRAKVSLLPFETIVLEYSVAPTRTESGWQLLKTSHYSAEAMCDSLWKSDWLCNCQPSVGWTHDWKS